MAMNISKLLVFVWVVIVNFKVAISDDGKETEDLLVKIVSPASFMETNANVYHTSLPLTFEVTLPHRLFHPETEECKGNITVGCKVGDVISSIFAHAVDDVTDFGVVSRVERQLGFIAAGIGGFLLRPVMGKIFPSLFGDDNEAKKLTNELQGTVDKLNEELVRFENHTLDFEQVIGTALQTMQDRMTDMQETIPKVINTTVETLANWMMRLSYTQEEASAVEQSILSCRFRHFPTRLVSGKKLRASLKQLEVDLLKRDYILSIPVERTNEYLKSAITDCMFTPSKAYVVINIPIRLKESKWKVYEIIYKTFAYENQTCALEPNDYSYLALEHNRAIMFRNPALQHCDLTRNSLCLIPRYTKQSSNNIKCMIDLINGKAVWKVLKSCEFKCWAGEELNIDQVGDNLYVTNARTINSICGNETKSYEPPEIGLVEIRMVCGCSLYINRMEVRAPIHCAKEALTLHATLPNIWSNNNETVQGNVFSGYENIFNKNWTTAIRTYNYSRNIIKVPPPIPMASFTFGLMEIWNTGLTVAVVILLLGHFGLCFRMRG